MKSLKAIVNTSTPAIAKLLKPLGVSFGVQMACDDNQSASKLHYANCWKIMGLSWLGPWANLRWSHALAVAEVAEKPLILNNESWERVFNYIHKLRGFVPDNNKQCLFPEGSTILHNTQGTADGCHITLKSSTPRVGSFRASACIHVTRPTITSAPHSQRLSFAFFQKFRICKETFRHSWMLLSTSESHLLNN